MNGKSGDSAAEPLLRSADLQSADGPMHQSCRYKVNTPYSWPNGRVILNASEEENDFMSTVTTKDGTEICYKDFIKT